uniref:Uncharacterized protein n=1 Tax=viral metagenome TaxID=1070528 RepID=A0A6C0E119_9ZZZZ
MGKKGTKSKTHPGRKNYTTKRGDKVYHRKGHYVKKTHKPYSYRKGSSSKTHLGLLDYTTKFGDLVFHKNGHYVRKSRKPYSKKSRKTRRR